MSKRQSESQLTKDQFEKMNNQNAAFSFRAGNGAGGGPDEIGDPTKMADSAVLSQRKIAPLRRNRPGARGSTRGDNIPNMFSGIAQGVTFGPNGTTQPQNTFGGFGATGGGNPAPPSFSTGFGGFGTNNGQQEQQKPNPFASLAPSSNGNIFQTQPQSPTPSIFGNSSSGFGSNNASQQTPTSTQASSFPFQNSNPEPPSSSTFKPPSFSFNGGSASAPTMFGDSAKPFTFGANSGGTSPAATPPAFGSFGSNAGPAPASNLFRPSPSPVPEQAHEPTPPIAAPKPQPSFNFGSSTAPASTSNPLFANTVGSSSLFQATPSPEPQNVSFFAPPKPTPSPEPPAQSPGLFGSQSTTPPVGGGLFGNSSTTKPGFSFGTPKPPTPQEEKQPQFGSWGTKQDEPVADAPKTWSFGQKPEEPAKPQRFGSPSLFDKAAEGSTSAGGLFGKPAENSTSTGGLFGKTAENSMFGKPTENSTFGKPADSSMSTNMFGAPAEDSASRGLFGKPVESPTPTSLFGKPVEKSASTGLFGKPVENSTSATSPFGKPVESAAPTSLFGKPVENSAPAPFGKPAEGKQDAPMAEPKKSPVFGGSPINFAKSSTASYPSLSAAPLHGFVPPPPKAPEPTSATKNTRTPSPPLPSEATSWLPSQLTEYYNLYGLRSLNHSFLQCLTNADQFVDWSTACEVYIKEAARIKACQENGEKYRGAKGHGKRSASISEEGGGKRRKEEDSTKSSNSSKALASILGGGGGGEKTAYQKLPDTPLFGFKAPEKVAGTSFGAGIKLAAAPLHGFKPPVATGYGNDVDMKLPDAPVHGFNPPGAVGSHGAVGQKLLDKPLHGFMPPSGSGVTAAIELASAPLHGFKPPGVASDGKNEKKKTSGSVFDSPNAPAELGGFVNPFLKKAGEENAATESDDDDDDDDGDTEGDKKKDTKKANSVGSLFDRISEPLGNDKEGGFFGKRNNDTTKPQSSLFGSGSTTASTTPAAGSSPAPSPSLLFGAPAAGKPEVGFSFGGSNVKPTGSISMPGSGSSDLLKPTSSISRNGSDSGIPSGLTTPGETPAPENSEPSDEVHNAQDNLDLSIQGPGEEDEDSHFEALTNVYQTQPKGKAEKAGSGTLRVLKNRTNGKARLLVRTPNGKVILNVRVMEKVMYEVSRSGASGKMNNVRIGEFLPNGTLKHWVVKVRDDALALELVSAINIAKIGS